MSDITPEQAIDEVENLFFAELHQIRSKAGKNQLKLLAEVSHAFRRSVNLAKSTAVN